MYASCMHMKANDVFQKQDGHYFLCCMWITWCLNSLCHLSLNRDIAEPVFSAWLYIFLNYVANYDSSEHFPFVTLDKKTYPEGDLGSYTDMQCVSTTLLPLGSHAKDIAIKNC